MEDVQPTLLLFLRNLCKIQAMPFAGSPPAFQPPQPSVPMKFARESSHGSQVVDGSSQRVKTMSKDVEGNASASDTFHLVAKHLQPVLNRTLDARAGHPAASSAVNFATVAQVVTLRTVAGQALGSAAQEEQATWLPHRRRTLKADASAGTW